MAQHGRTDGQQRLRCTKLPDSTSGLSWPSAPRREYGKGKASKAGAGRETNVQGLRYVHRQFSKKEQTEYSFPQRQEGLPPGRVSHHRNLHCRHRSAQHMVSNISTFIFLSLQPTTMPHLLEHGTHHLPMHFTERTIPVDPLVSSTCHI